MQRSFRDFLSLFFLSAAVLSFEIAMIKIFEYAYWEHLAFFMISTAMFGTGMSGVVLNCREDFWEKNGPSFQFLGGVLCGLTMLLSFFVANNVSVFSSPDSLLKSRDWLFFGVLLVSLSLPFFFFGIVLILLFQKQTEKIAFYYSSNLLGSALGGILPVFTIVRLAPQGIIFLSSMAACATSLAFFYEKGRRGNGKGVLLGVCCALLISSGIGLAPRFSKNFPLHTHVQKRQFPNDSKDRIEASRWSILSQAEVSQKDSTSKVVWINGGRNQSALHQFDGDFVKLRRQREEALKNASLAASFYPLAHLSKRDHTVCIIGTGGGYDAYRALEMGARHVTGIEMDPAMAYLVTVTYKDYAGHLFSDGRFSNLVIDEGRSFLKRSQEKFDVIQQVYNYSPAAMASGALNLSEMYLLTNESFNVFYDRLADDGILAITRWGTVRLLTTAVNMLKQRGLSPQEYATHLVVCRGAHWDSGTLLLKKSPFSREEVDRIFNYYAPAGQEKFVMYAPYREKELPDLNNNVYYKIATESHPELYWHIDRYDFSPTTDARPFFNNMALEVPRHSGTRSPLLPDEIVHDEAHRNFGIVVASWLLWEGIVLFLLFIGLPLLFSARARIHARGHWREWLYFSCIGLGFVLIELYFVQQFVLLLGGPAYSIAFVSCSILTGSGLGSLWLSVMKRLSPEKEQFLLGLLVLVVTLAGLGVPLMIELFLARHLMVRGIIAFLLAGGVGFLMGLPMPLGMRHLEGGEKSVVCQAWALNSFFTIMGSGLSVLAAVNAGFPLVFFLGAIFYGLAFCCRL